MPEGNKTERATPRRRQKAREQGQVARSRDLIASAAIFAAVLALAGQAGTFGSEWRRLLRQNLETSVSREDRAGSLVPSRPTLDVFGTLGLVLGLTWAGALVGSLAQGGLIFAPEALLPKLSRISPAARLEQLFSLSAIGRLLKSLLPAGAVVWIATALVIRDWPILITLPRLSGGALGSFTLGRGYEVAWKSSLVLLTWSGADYFIERQRLESQLRMSKQDLRDEHKEIEGHPAIKARIRRLQRQLRRRRMLEDAKRATVVITNPSEYAVALEYSPEMPAPKVVAKGLNLFAQQIKQVARWQGIPLVENPPLAHALYRAAEVGQSIPPKLYTVVAEILAAIYRAEERARRQESARGQEKARAAQGGR